MASSDAQCSWHRMAQNIDYSFRSKVEHFPSQLLQSSLAFTKLLSQGKFCLTTKALGIDYTNKLHLFKLPYTQCMNEFILFKKVSKLQDAIITRYCKMYFGILYLYNVMLFLVPIF